MQYLGRLWVLLSEKKGDNVQALTLGEALSTKAKLELVKKNIRFFDLKKIPQEADINLLDKNKSDPLTPPWPDFIISTGYLCAAIACWIKKQHPKTKIIQLGRPKRPFALFDLIISTPQFRLPPAKNHLPILLPLGGKRELESNYLRYWQSYFSSKARPLCMLAIGGIAKRLRTDKTSFQDLLERAFDHVKTTQGSLVIVTSPRTPEFVHKLVEDYMSKSSLSIEFFPYGKDQPNPYNALLELADEVIATNDSASMPADAVQAGKPLYLHEFPLKKPAIPWRYLARGQFYRFLCLRRDQRYISRQSPDIWDRWIEGMIKNAKALPRRNPGIFARALYERQLATPLSTTKESASPVFHTYCSELDQVVDRILKMNSETRKETVNE